MSDRGKAIASLSPFTSEGSHFYIDPLALRAVGRRLGGNDLRLSGMSLAGLGGDHETHQQDRQLPEIWSEVSHTTILAEAVCAT